MRISIVMALGAWLLGGVFLQGCKHAATEATVKYGEQAPAFALNFKGTASRTSGGKLYGFLFDFVRDTGTSDWQQNPSSNPRFEDDAMIGNFRVVRPDGNIYCTPESCFLELAAPTMTCPADERRSLVWTLHGYLKARGALTIPVNGQKGDQQIRCDVKNKEVMCAFNLNLSIDLQKRRR